MEMAKEYVSPKQEHEAIIEDQNTCCLCGTKLKFQHNVDYMTLTVKEDANCPTCMIQMRSREFSLQ